MRNLLHRRRSPATRQLRPRQRFANLALAALLFASLAFAQPNVLTSNYDNQRTNANLQETTLNASNVNTANFGRLGAFPVDGQIYAQPLYVGGVQVTGKGPHNVIFVATMHNSVYAIDADATQSNVALWQMNLGTSVPSSVLNFYDAVPEVGILSTPVIDLSRQAIYVVAETLDNGAPMFLLHALSLADGREILNGPVAIGANIAGNTDGSSGGVLPFDATWHLQRPGLALANGTVYLAFGSHADAGLFHGWMMGYDASNLKRQVAVFNSSPNAWGGSIWQSGRAPAIDESGNLYVVTGNGEFDGASSFGESILKLSASLSLNDYFTPDIWMQMREDDEDFSTGVILIPNTDLAVAGSKAGMLHLVHRNGMGHLGSGNSSSVKTGDFAIFSMALWNSPNGPLVYVQNSFSPLQAYRIAGGAIDATPQSQTTSAYQTMFAGIAVSSDGSAGGIVWETTGDTQKAQVPGTLHAFDASDLSIELWNSDMSALDTLGRFAKFVAPTVVNGRVYVPTFSNSLAIYGLLPGGQPVNTPTEIAGIVNGASFTGDAVSPGELIAIFGYNIGPAQLANAQFDATGHVTTTLSDTQVFFDGIAAPVLYTSSNQAGVIVPFGVAGPQTQVEVRYQGQVSFPIMIPVVQATPAIFSLDGTGGGPGAIVNQDGNLNSGGAPAGRGSIVLLYATGLGQMNPAADDGQIVSAAPFPMPLLPVQVFIDGQPAEVLYAGAAPDMVQGVLQINVRIPDAASSGEVHVVVRAGDYSSPNTVTLFVQ
ncbi:MAG TPA: hypothetical protein VGV35_03255 [Bryobacteraceae bacterium]|nr:hypothetical protein [Bryobacteraceae bacterium]